MSAIEGPLTFATASVWFARLPELSQSDTIDLAGVTACDSAGAALLIELQRQARRSNRALQFIHAPHKLRELLEFFGVDRLLSVAA